MTQVYQVTVDELRIIHVQKVRALYLNRAARVLFPWRWVWFRAAFLGGKPQLIREWVTWSNLHALCSRPGGFTVARTERGQDINYKLIR